jgi:hypothetical protein
MSDPEPNLIDGENKKNVNHIGIQYSYWPFVLVVYLCWPITIIIN